MEGIDVVPRIQQFKLQSSLFQVSMQLRIEYSWITNQTLHSFSSTVQTFQWWTSAAQSVFKQCSKCSPAAATQTSVYRGYLHDASQLNPSYQADDRSSATCSSSIFVRIICSYRFSPKSLLAKCIQFVFTTQFNHHKNINNCQQNCTLLVHLEKCTFKFK